MGNARCSHGEIGKRKRLKISRLLALWVRFPLRAYVVLLYTLTLYGVIYVTSPNLVQETAIEKILEEHLWTEIDLLIQRQRRLMDEVTALQEREQKLRNIAHAAELSEVHT